jgi:tetratricopeptide (TPR) repeat protein
LGIAFSVFVAGAAFRETSIFLGDVLSHIKEPIPASLALNEPAKNFNRERYWQGSGSATNYAEARAMDLYARAQQEMSEAILSDNFEKAERNISQAIKLAPNKMLLRLAQARLRVLSGKPVSELKAELPATDGDRIAYASGMMQLNKFDTANQQLNILINNANNAEEILAVADLSQMLKELDAAEAAYRKALCFPGAEQQSRRGLQNIERLRAESSKDLAVARDFRRLAMYDAAIDKYRESITKNPKNMMAHYELAETIQRHPIQSSDGMREAAREFRAYLGLRTGLRTDEQARITQRAAYLDQEALLNDERTVIAHSEDLSY